MNKRGKAAANLKKHQVSFEKAKSIFFEEFGVQFFDEDPSADEERFPMLGMSSGSKLLIVCHREQGAVIRIISARKKPYASRLKKPVTMRLSEDVVEYSRPWSMRLTFPTRVSLTCTCATVLPTAAKRKSNGPQLFNLTIS